MKVHYFASHLSGHYKECLASIHGKLQYVVHLEHQGSWDWAKKIDYQYRVAKENPDEVLLFMDLWDSLFIGDPDELEADIKDMPGCVIQSSWNPWPRADIAHKFPDKGKWRFINGAGASGYGRDIAKAIKWGNKRYPVIPAFPDHALHKFPINDNDARFWIDLYFDGKCDVDHECRIVQQMNGIAQDDLVLDGKRILNTRTGRRPHFLHASCGTWDKIPQELLPNA